MSAPVFDLREMLGTLERQGVRYVAIGGVAVAAHGYVRATEDLDIVPQQEASNLGRLADALVALDATLPTADGRRFNAGSDLPKLLKRQSMTLDTRAGGLDVVQRVPGVPGFTELKKGAIDVNVDGVRASICSLAHLRAMKQVRGGKQDLADLEVLPED